MEVKIVHRQRNSSSKGSENKPSEEPVIETFEYKDRSWAYKMIETGHQSARASYDKIINAKKPLK